MDRLDSHRVVNTLRLAYKFSRLINLLKPNDIYIRGLEL